MTVATTINRVAYAGNGSTASFAIPYPFTAAEDIEVVLSTPDGETGLVPGADYQLSGAGEPSGGTCTLTVPPAGGEILVIRRDPAIVQEVDYIENEAFPAATHEAALDRLTMVCQALAERLDRTLSFRVSSAVTGVELPDPDPGRLLGWDANGENLRNADLANFGEVALPLAVEQGGTGAGTSSEALDNLGFGATGKVLAGAASSAQGRAILDAEPADTAILKANVTDTLEVGFTAQANAMATAGPTPATGALQTIDTSAGAVSLGAPAAAGVIRFIVSGTNALNPSASYDSISGKYDTAVGLAQGEIVSDGVNHFLTIVNAEA